jgi:hypothetical protein
MDRIKVMTAVVLALLVVSSTSAVAQDSARGLRGLSRVALELSLAADLVDLESDLEQRVEDALREHPSAPALRRDSADKLRLVVTVQPRDASDLRGFWLPFSGTYAIGAVRLEVERVLTLPGSTPIPATVPAIVWQAERSIARPWSKAAAEIEDAVDTLVGAFLEDYRRARAR